MRSTLNQYIALSFALIFLSSQCLYSQSKISPKKEFLAEFNKAVPEWLEEFNVPGAAIALIEDGEIILQNAYGYADVKNKVKVDLNTGFNMGSVSKTVAAWGVMKLVEEGKIGLDDPAEKHLTRWKLPESEFDSKGVTIRRLLSHTAGLSLHGYPGWAPEDGLPSIEESLSGKTNGSGGVKLIMEPGSQYKYSGGGYTILQLIVEEVSGMSFNEFMTKNIFLPLGMKNSTYGVSEEVLKNSSLGHDTFGEVIPFELFTAQAAAGFQTNIEDFVKFALASLDPQYENGVSKYSGLRSQTVLKSESIDLMLKAAPATEGRYGLGYVVDSLENSDILLSGHGGANTGWRALLFVDKAGQDGFISVTNSGAGTSLNDQAFCKWIEWKTGFTFEDRCKKNLNPEMIRIIKKDGVEAAIERYQEIKKTEASSYSIVESAFNNLGYELMGRGMKEEALAIFKLNVEEYPEAWNVYDSLGETYFEMGNWKASKENYLKSIELNPLNEYGKEMLEKLKDK